MSPSRRTRSRSSALTLHKLYPGSIPTNLKYTEELWKAFISSMQQLSPDRAEEVLNKTHMNISLVDYVRLSNQPSRRGNKEPNPYITVHRMRSALMEAGFIIYITAKDSYHMIQGTDFKNVDLKIIVERADFWCTQIVPVFNQYLEIRSGQRQDYTVKTTPNMTLLLDAFYNCEREAAKNSPHPDTENHPGENDNIERYCKPMDEATLKRFMGDREIEMKAAVVPAKKVKIAAVAASAPKSPTGGVKKVRSRRIGVRRLQSPPPPPPPQPKPQPQPESRQSEEDGEGEEYDDEEEESMSTDDEVNK
ncbi:CUN103 hypothetical protein [Culex nigripalpus nucleopolyhedrovirus]|uniref:Uncharacterized protein n=1 Tax=Culex nigripalpus nucleopolyhedrovirus (isolate Florida/1997) TaxID=645993 RepID=Q919H4_NPVCO|nr:CUN103 hypothetical protein [Culex nigripalpus nucleopolyhedrovirus]AAK94181.1 CUN103 hypothetical protein [Culex nigripalpus nucleopolyhedrovirus]